MFFPHILMPGSTFLWGVPPNIEFLPPGSDWRVLAAHLDSGGLGGLSTAGMVVGRFQKDREHLGSGNLGLLGAGRVWDRRRVLQKGLRAEALPGTRARTNVGHFVAELEVFLWQGGLCLPATAIR